jgi:hypothetical protein
MLAKVYSRLPFTKKECFYAHHSRDLKMFKVALLLRNWKNLQVPYIISTVALAFWKSIRERGGLVTLKFSKSPFSFAIGKIYRFRTSSVR